jgi:hypothetical protein
MARIRKQKATDPHVLVTWVKEFENETRQDAFPGKLIHHPDKPDGVLAF